MTDINMNSFKNKVIFVPSCLLCPEFLAKKTESPALWRHIIISYLNDNNYSIIQMPCPEASFPDSYSGLNRNRHSIDYYEKLPGYKEHCIDIGDNVITQIDALYKSGYSVSALLGIEYSSTCAVNYLYSLSGTKKRRGIFINILTELIKKRGYYIPIIGISRCYPQKTIERLMKIDRM